jgi:predicted deacetylase
MISRPAQYLLRFDDLCPTMDRERWERFLPLLAQYKIRPILAVVPDNQDRALELSPPDAGFWEEMRARQASGATIALHGYRHLCVNRGRSLVPLAGLKFCAATDWSRIYGSRRATASIVPRCERCGSRGWG